MGRSTAATRRLGTFCDVLRRGRALCHGVGGASQVPSFDRGWGEVLVNLSSSVLGWSAAAVGASARVVGVEPLREDPGDRGPWLLHVEYGRDVVDVVLKTGPADREGERRRTPPEVTRSLMATEAAAMVLAEEHQLPASRLVAVDLDGESGGVLAILSTAIPGQSTVPDQPRSLRTLGAAAAKVHAVRLAPRPDLPLRVRPRHGEDYIPDRARAARRRERYRTASNAERDMMVRELIAAYPDDRPRWSPECARRVIEEASTTPLIEEAEERLRDLPKPRADSVFVHDDLCGGNTVWTDHQSVTLIDWEGAGHAGVDLGNLRFAESLHFGLPAAREVLEGWKQESGQDPGPLAYWDLVAALNTPADMTRWAYRLPQATERRDRFLRAVLDRLDGHDGADTEGA